LEEALKAPIIQLTPLKMEKDSDMDSSNFSSLSFFDPETLIPPHAVSRPNIKAQARKKMKIRFSQKSKKSKQKQKGFHPKSKSHTGSAVEGVIPYHEGPYFKNSHQNQSSSGYVDDNGELVKIVRMKKEEIINCICGFGEEDGLMIQCELCLCWQHGYCYRIESSNQVPEKHVCYACKYPTRQRSSMRFIHDQDWLFDGKLPIANYHVKNPKQAARFDMLKNCHTLIGNLVELKKYMNALDVKINIAENIDHPKMYLWSKKWEKSPSREKTDVDMRDVDVKDDNLIVQPLAPEPEAAIDSRKCQQTLIDHIQFQQNSLKSRLDTIENEINGN
jgi:hypothetical protein